MMRYLGLGLLLGWVAVVATLSDFPDFVAKQERAADPLPKYLREFGGLFVRIGDEIRYAPVEDIEVAKRYPLIPWKDRKRSGERRMILTAKRHYRVNEPVRVIHVHEASVPGQMVYVMGPQSIYSEYVDRKQVTPDPPMLQGINGLVVPGPIVNYNYEITEYRFSAPGEHRIQWGRGEGRSNVLTITIHR
jgi:hypothetical protein